MEESKNQLNWGIFSQYRGEAMGFAILWIMLFHGIGWVGELPHGGIFNYILKNGNAGVEIFLFVSAIGLYFSLSRDGSLTHFYIRRLKRVVIPYLVMAPFLYVWQDLICNHSVKTFLLDYSQLSFWMQGARRLWYIPFIVVLYVTAPFFFRLLQPENTHRTRNLVAFLIIYVIFLTVMDQQFHKAYAHVALALYRVPIFVIGMYLAAKVKRRDRFTELDLLVFFTITSLETVVIGTGLVGLPYRLMTNVLGIVLTLFFVLVSHQLAQGKLAVVHAFVKWCGTSSLELYIVHVILRRYFISYWAFSPWIGFALWFVLSLLTAYAVTKIQALAVSAQN